MKITMNTNLFLNPYFQPILKDNFSESNANKIKDSEKKVQTVNLGHSPLSWGNKKSSNILTTITSLQERIQQIKESDMPLEKKNEMIQNLEQEISGLQKEILEERKRELEGQISEENEEREEEQTYEIIDKRTMVAITSSTFSYKNSKVAYSQYNRFKNEKDLNGMKKASKIAVEELSDANSHINSINKGKKASKTISKENTKKSEKQKIYSYNKIREENINNIFNKENKYIDIVL